MYQAFISQGEIGCSFRAYPYGGFGKDSWKRPCLFEPPACLTSQCCPLSWGCTNGIPAGQFGSCSTAIQTPHFLSFGCGVAIGQGERRYWVCPWLLTAFSEVLKGLGFFLKGFKGLGFPPSGFKGLSLVSWMDSSLCDLSSWPTALLQFQLNKLFLIFCLFTFAASC